MSWRTLNKSVLMILLPFMFLAIIMCSKTTIEEPEEEADVASCEGCHTNYEHLQLVYSEDTTESVGGCGGDAPHYEPYDRVYMGDEGFEAYKSSGHYSIGCTGCHNGTDNVEDKELAHSGDFIRHPSMFSGNKCAGCHKEISDHFATSIHQGTGQKRKVAIRSGLEGPQDFDQLPAHQIEGYDKNCAICHGTCGNCHVVRPPAGGGGLAEGHAFTKTPDMQSVCITCHTSRGGHAYLGIAPGTQPDVHLTKKDFTCMNCHEGAELHGNGTMVEQRYAYGELPKCENCHPDVMTDNANMYHKMHVVNQNLDFNCQVCHSQDYNNCGSCHIHGEGARIASYQGFKIAKNPIPDVKTGYDFALVRRTLAAPDNWKEYGVDEYADFSALPTYNYTTPHNILRWTARTSGETCSSGCHIRNDNGVLINKELYLFQEDLEDWELEATSKITVDGALPSSWTQK
jgi:thiosulfate/3-mercaptopyruvate sulfurtransferase